MTSVKNEVNPLFNSRFSQMGYYKNHNKKAKIDLIIQQSSRIIYPWMTRDERERSESYMGIVGSATW